MDDDKLIDDTSSSDQPLEIDFEVRPEECLAADQHARARLGRLAVPARAATLYISFVFMASCLGTLLMFTVAAQRKGAEARLLYVALALYGALLIGMGL